MWGRYLSKKIAYSVYILADEKFESLGYTLYKEKIKSEDLLSQVNKILWPLWFCPKLLSGTSYGWSKEKPCM